MYCILLMVVIILGDNVLKFYSKLQYVFVIILRFYCIFLYAFHFACLFSTLSLSFLINKKNTFLDVKF